MVEVQIEQGATARRAYKPDSRTLHTLVPGEGCTDVTASSHPEVVVR
jgi:hypothetical protein